MNRIRNQSVRFVACASVAIGLSGVLVVKISRGHRSPSSVTVSKLVNEYSGGELVSENKFGNAPIIFLGGGAYPRLEKGSGVHKRTITVDGSKFAVALPIENEYRINLVEDAHTGMRDWLVIKIP